MKAKRHNGGGAAGGAGSIASAPAAAQAAAEIQLDLPSLSRARLLVVGDAMLDRYWFGEVLRISPEAPVPVVKVERTEERPGGAANVARNIAALGAQVSLLSVVGEDEAGGTLQQLVEDAGIKACLHRDPSISTTVKLRVIGRQQQLLRIDFETHPSHEVLLDKLADYRRLLASCDAVVLSDYGKGGLVHIAQMIALAREQGKIVLVDPKGDDYARYEGASIVTPNRAELREVVGRWSSEEDLARKAQALRQELRLDALLVTRSEEGMTLFQEGRTLHEPAQAREVYDVSGAGDTVIGTLAVLLAAGSPITQAMRVANYAAGIVVGKLGTAVVHPEELLSSIPR
jgi:rfaE bifunctional protein kinase chain/domain